MKKTVLKNFAIFTGKHLYWSLFLIKFQAFSPATLSKKRLLGKILRTFILKNICEWLLLDLLAKVAYGKELSTGS